MKSYESTFMLGFGVYAIGDPEKILNGGFASLDNKVDSIGDSLDVFKSGLFDRIVVFKTTQESGMFEIKSQIRSAAGKSLKVGTSSGYLAVVPPNRLKEGLEEGDFFIVDSFSRINCEIDDGLITVGSAKIDTKQKAP